jgi:coniferyl-aldehyde dehydrogenase
MASQLERMKRLTHGKAPTYAERVTSLRALERLLLDNKAAIIEAVSQDFGSRSRHETLAAEIFVAVECVRHTLSHLSAWMMPERRQVGWAFLPASAKVMYQPLGVVGIISPWNYPLQLALAPLVAALAAGNRAMIKPSELTPRTSALLQRLVSAHFHADQVVVFTGGTDVGDAFSKLPFDHLLFTGSTAVGARSWHAAAAEPDAGDAGTGRQVAGHRRPDFPLELAADASFGKLFNAGQTCIAPDYVFVPRDARDRFVEACHRAAATMYPTLENNPDYTSIINDRHYQRLTGYLADADTRGAKLVRINPAQEPLDPARRKLAPTLVLDAREDMTVLQDELFGPILPVLTYGQLSEALDYVNAHERPLALYGFSHDQRTVDRILEETISGGVTINDTLLHFAQEDLPFGGVGASGMGHYHGFEGFESMSKKKPVLHQARFNATGLLNPPYGALIDRFMRFVLGK